MFTVEPEYQPRFVSKEELLEMINLYHLARTALAGEKAGRYERLQWAVKQFCKTHPERSQTGAYKDLSAQLER